MANGYYNSAFDQPPKRTFDFQGLLQGLLQGAAGATQARNPWQGALLGGAGAIDYMNQDAMRQAYIQNLIQDNLRGQQYYDLQNKQFDWQKQKYDENRYLSPEDAEYERTKRQLDINEQRLKNRKTGKEIRLMGQPKPEDTLGKNRKEYDDIQQELVKLTSNQEYYSQETPQKQSRIDYLARRSTELEKSLGLQRPLDMQEQKVIGTGMSDIIRKGVQDAFPNQIPEGQTPHNKILDKETARNIYLQAGGDKAKAEAIARQMGYEF